MAEDMKTIEIDGKDYTMVHERIKYFNANYPDGGIECMMLSPIGDENIIMKALVTPDWKENPQRRFTGHSMAVYNPDDEFMKSALEIAETSAIGRALGAMAIGITDRMASADEMKKAKSKFKKAAKVVDYDTIKDEDQKKEALSISEAVNGAETLEQLDEIKDLIKKAELSSEVVNLVKKDYNYKRKSLLKG